MLQRQAAIGLAGAEGVEQLRRAIEEVRADLAGKTARLQSAGLTAESGILEAQALMLDDPALVDGVAELMAQGRPADESVASAMAPFAEMLRTSPDPVFQARAADVEDVVDQLRRALHGAGGTPPPPLQPSIVVARDLAPSQTAGLDRALVLGFATEQGSATAHTAILARALGLPAVVGIAGLVDAVEDGQAVLLDGDDGSLVIDPSPDLVATVRPPADAASDAEPAITRDGRRVEVGCNAAGVDDARRAAAAGADGIGLLRSEFLFLGSDRLPSEDEQVAVLEEVTTAMGERPVILRTLDVGADKPLPALPQPLEANPALGVRGLRLQLLRRPDLLLDQLRAALRVSARHPLRLMFPMVSTLDEVRQAKVLLDQARRDVTPSPADGTGMRVGINRTNPELAPLADSLHPALLRMVDQVVKAAHRRNRWVGVCGEMASDLWAVPLLVGLGIDELSVHPPAVARIKALVRSLDAAACGRAARAALKLDSGAAVRYLVERRGWHPRA